MPVSPRRKKEPTRRQVRGGGRTRAGEPRCWKKASGARTERARRSRKTQKTTRLTPTLSACLAMTWYPA
uniref:Uncharacterized protein n=1 Tax=Arundo donax TaxID=35708 RepID=A0A0A9DSV5_ARUDO